MEKNEISIHEIRIFQTLSTANGKWLTNHDIAVKAQVANRTARAHTAKLVQLGILDIAEVFPGHRYKLSDKADKRNMAYVQRLRQAAEVFDIKLTV